MKYFLIALVIIGGLLYALRDRVSYFYGVYPWQYEYIEYEYVAIPKKVDNCNGNVILDDLTKVGLIQVSGNCFISPTETSKKYLLDYCYIDKDYVYYHNNIVLQAPNDDYFCVKTMIYDFSKFLKHVYQYRKNDKIIVNIHRLPKTSTPWDYTSKYMNNYRSDRYKNRNIFSNELESYTVREYAEYNELTYSYSGRSWNMERESHENLYKQMLVGILNP